MASTVDLGKLKVDDFNKHLNASFEIQDPDGKAVTTLKLVEAAPSAAKPPAPPPATRQTVSSRCRPSMPPWLRRPRSWVVRGERSSCNSSLHRTPG